MTIRNAVPRFGIRWAVVLAAVAAVVIAALLAVGSPASAQTSDDPEIWSGTITVGANATYRGYYERGSPTTDYGSLDDKSFTYDGTSYNIAVIIDSPASDGLLIFGSTQLNSLAEQVFRLHIGGRTFDFEDANIVQDGTLYAYQWSIANDRFGWAENDEVAVKITERKSISVEGGLTASGQDVEYGGNNNAAESTAIFWFTRTGNIDEALTFSFTHAQSGETATRTFKAGQSEFFNAHWAIDVDESNNPVCLITWTIVEPVPGYIVYLNPAFALVEGPGTTCMGTM